MNASLYDDVAAWTLALPANTSSIILQKSIHGSRKNVGTSRIMHTGLKHSVFNKLRLRGQAQLYDRASCIMIVPVMTLESVKGWDGSGYQALVMAGQHCQTSIDVVCSGIGMLVVGQTATDENIEVARNMLDQVVRGLAHSLFRPDRVVPAQQRQALEDLKRRFQAPESVKIPTSTNQNIRVRMVNFGGDSVHPAPDPLLLTIKAAINWFVATQPATFASW